MDWTRKEIKSIKDIEWAISLFEAGKEVSFDLETTGLNLIKDKLFCFGFGFKTIENKGISFVLYTTPTLSNQHKEWIVKIQKEIFEKASLLIIHNAKYDLHILENSGVAYGGDNVFCNKIFAFYTFKNKEIKDISLKPLAKNLLKFVLVNEKKLLNHKKILDEKYKAERSILFSIHNQNLEKFDVWIENPLLFKKELEGIEKSFIKAYIDFKVKNKKPSYYNIPKDILLPYAFDDIEILLEVFFKIKNFAKKAIFDRTLLHSKVIKIIISMEKRGYHMDAFGIEQLIAIKENETLRLFNKVRNNKYYFTFSQMPSKTGRLQCGLQNLEKDKRVFFEAPEDYILFCFDYNQIEFRLQAEFVLKMSLEDFIKYPLPELFLENDKFDIHSSTAEKLLNLESDIPFIKRRQCAKILNHAILYGAGLEIILNKGQEFGFSRAFIREFYKNFKTDFVGLFEWKRKKITEFLKRGFSENLYGEIIFGVGNYKNLNHLVQSSGSSLLKRKLLEINDFLKKGEYKSYIQFCIHDEIQLCIHKTEKRIVNRIKKILEQESFTIPLKVKISFGKKWGALKEWE